MKVCGKKDIHVPGCSDCQELEERVEAVEECCEDAQTKIEDKADTTYVDENIGTIEGQITEVSDALNERIDNIITSSEPSITTLWEGALSFKGDSAQLSDDVSNYDFLDVYYKTSTAIDSGYYGYIRVPADEYENYTTTIGGINRRATGAGIRQYLTMLSFVDDTATIQDIRRWYWDGSAASDAEDSSYQSGIGIYRIDGVKISGVDAEIADARVGVDGTVYPSLGDAIRGQIQDTRDMIPQLVKTVQGNPVVIDDAFGEVKNLDVELTPIQDLHGYDKPWSAGAINKVNTQNLPVTITSQSVIDEYQTTKQTTWTASVNCTNNASIVGMLNIYAYNGNTLVRYKTTQIPVGTTNQIISATLDLSADTITKLQIVITGASAGYSITVNKTQINEGQPLDQIYPYSNICPITGHDSVIVTDSGKNVWDGEYLQGYYTATGAFTSNTTQICTKNLIPVKPNETYWLKVASYAGNTNLGGAICYYNSTGTFIERVAQRTGTITIPSNCCYIKLNIGATYGGTYNGDISLNYPSTITTQETYKTPQTKTVTLPHTVYGGKPNITTGNGTETRGITTFADLIWGYSSADARFYSNSLTYNRQSPNALCSQYQTVTLANLVDGSICVYSNGYIYVKDSRFTDASTFKQAMGSTQLCYELATPTDLSTTPTDITLYNGDNVISSDGEMELSYVQDMAAVIRKIENQL